VTPSRTDGGSRCFPRITSIKGSFRKLFAPRRSLAVTTCAAAICKRGTQDVVLAISDRRFTSGEKDNAIKFEPEHQTKFFGLVPAKAICLIGGDPSPYSMVTKQTHNRLERDNITDITHVARVYADNFTSLRQTRNQDLGMQAIIAGLDLGGAHVFHVTDPGSESCRDQIGFVAMGIGSTIFEEEMAFWQYDRGWPCQKALFLMYLAKKKSEINEGISETTDILMIDDRADSFVVFDPRGPVLDSLHRHYAEFEKTKKEKVESIIREIENDGLFSFLN
jgi:hypothetical protein